MKERLLREEKLTLEKAVGMARASEASKEQLKIMNSRAQSSEGNQSVNVLRSEVNQSANVLRSGAHQGKEQVANHRRKTKIRKVWILWYGSRIKIVPGIWQSMHLL